MDEVAKISQFTSLTQADVSTARFYLDSHNWEVESAIEAFFDSAADAEHPPVPYNPSSGFTGGAGAPGQASQSAAAQASGGSAKGKGAAPPVGGRRIATLAGMGVGHQEEDEDEPQGYYAGGEKSGQIIQDPREVNKKKQQQQQGMPGIAVGPGGRGGDPESIFQRAQAMQENTAQDLDQLRNNQRFTGAGYRLGSTESAADSVANVSAPAVIGKKLVTKRLVFYANGFIVSGEDVLRGYDDPANAAFMRDIGRGFVPKELETEETGQVDIELEDRRGEDYVPVKPKVKVFSGEGQRLGGPSTPAASAARPAVSASTSTVVVNESSPVCTIQVRLANGQKVVVRLNENHTIADLRALIESSHPESRGANYELATTFPRTILDNFGATVAACGLKGAVVVQTLR